MYMFWENMCDKIIIKNQRMNWIKLPTIDDVFVI